MVSGRTGSPAWWTASSGTYYWVLDQRAAAVTDNEAASLHGFRTFDLEWLSPLQRLEVLALIRGPLGGFGGGEVSGGGGSGVRW